MRKKRDEKSSVTAATWHRLCNHKISVRSNTEHSLAVGWAIQRKGTLRFAVCFLLLLIAKATLAQVQVGDDVTMRMNGNITAGYAGDYGNLIPSDHGLNFGADAQLSGDYYNPNFMNSRSRLTTSIQRQLHLFIPHRCQRRGRHDKPF